MVSWHLVEIIHHAWMNRDTIDKTEDFLATGQSNGLKLGGQW